MIYVKLNDQREVTDLSTEVRSGAGWESRWDWKTETEVHRIAEGLTQLTGDLYLGIDRGRGVSNRYDVCRAPKVGDPVSYAFNGDYHPDGEIKSVSKTLKVVTTTTGHSYYRAGQSAAWVLNKTWVMVPGHIERQNPHL